MENRFILCVTSVKNNGRKRRVVFHYFCKVPVKWLLVRKGFEAYEHDAGYLITVFRPANGSSSATNIVRYLVVNQIFKVLRLFSFQNGSLLNFAYSWKTLFSIIAPCWIFKLSPNWLVIFLIIKLPQHRQRHCLHTKCHHLPRCSMAASDDTWRIEMTWAFPGPTAKRCCSCLVR